MIVGLLLAMLTGMLGTVSAAGQAVAIPAEQWRYVGAVWTMLRIYNHVFPIFDAVIPIILINVLIYGFFLAKYVTVFAANIVRGSGAK
jgi:hypothetical protein